MKKMFKTQLTSVFTFLFVVALLASCKKKDDTPSDGKFPLTNFNAKITKQENVPSQSAVLIDFDIKNTSGTDYVVQKYALNPVKLKLTVIANDGSAYNLNSYVADVQAGNTFSAKLAVDYSVGKTIDLTKSKIELLY
ncbi:hypothetical protein HDC90_000443 [Pedobacter sp. AK013]|uniref:hypothetical protein n=1 Tax=Pedobacter sp. AK013 TaxID=2723071 RepID=UPI00160D889E|nr:hypothetical protein [Pedobacter sp. AK013]MBB6235843.1 hypothetical protein [Pedobacter sp. AK013]